MDIKLDQAAALLQVQVGRTLGKIEIARKYRLIRSVFPFRMENIIRKWMAIYFPYRTGNYHDKVLESMIVEWGKIHLHARNVPYSWWVEQMVGVLWTNAMTVEQPMRRLKSFIMTEMIQIISELKDEVGL